MPRTVCFSQWKVRASSSKVAPFFRLSIAITWAILLPSRGPPPSFALAVFLALGAFLAGVAFLVALPLAGAPLAGCARLVPFFSAFGFAACSACGCSGSPRLLMLSQMRATAALVLLKLSTGVTPVRLLKIETSRSAGHALASSTSSFWLLKLSKGVAVAAAASSWLENATISFVSLIVSRHNRCPFCHALRGHHMNPSEALESKGLSEINRPWGRTGDVPDADVSKCQKMSQN